MVVVIEPVIPVVLASASPRRQELLSQVLSAFEVIPANVDEEALVDADPGVTAQRLAREKALAVSALHPDSLVIGGDTVVALDFGGSWKQLAKPGSAEEAVAILEELSGATHTVITGVCLVWLGGMNAFTEVTQVTFRQLEREEIEAYVATGSPMDKAGAYGLQDESQSFIEKVEGSVTNVIGLPMEKLE